MLATENVNCEYVAFQFQSPCENLLFSKPAICGP